MRCDFRPSVMTRSMHHMTCRRVDSTTSTCCHVVRRRPWAAHMDDPLPRTSTPSSPTSQGHPRSLSPASHVSNRDRRAGTPTLHGPPMSAMSDLLPSLKHTGDDDRAPERAETPALFRPIERGRDCQLSPLPALTFAPLDGSDWPHSPMPPDVVESRRSHSTPACSLSLTKTCRGISL